MLLPRHLSRALVLVSVTVSSSLFAQGVPRWTPEESGAVRRIASEERILELVRNVGSQQPYGQERAASASSVLQFTFQSASTCNLAVTVLDLDRSTRSNATVKRFGQKGLLDSRTTNGSGQAVWDNIATGAYRFDAYFQRTDPFDTAAMFWARATATLTQAVQVLNLPRNQPAVGSFRVYRDDDNSDVTGGVVDVGTAVRLEVGVWNNSVSPGDTRVRLRLDRSRSSPWDFDQLADYVTIPGGGQFVATFTPDQPGVYYGAFKVEVTQEGKTDSRDWFVAFQAASLEGRFEASTNSLDFGSVEVGLRETRSFTVKNLGSTDIELETLLIDGSGFSLSDPGAIDLAGHETVEIAVVFTPPDVQAYSDSLVLYPASAPLRTSHIQLNGAGTTAGDQPVGDFEWNPNPATVNDTISFQMTGREGKQGKVSWDFDNDGVCDATGKSAQHKFPAPGSYTVSVTVENANGRDATSKKVVVTGGDRPYVKNVNRQYPGFFLEGADFTNQFSADVDWKGSPGKIAFSINGASPTWHDGDTTGASHLFKMDRDFSAGFHPTRVLITPRNAAGVEGSPWAENVFVFPWPRWLEVATGGNGVQFQVGQGEVKTLIGLQFPRVPLASGCDPEHGANDCWINIPDWVPLFSGELGLTKTYATLDGQLSSRGTGDFRLYGQTGFTAAKRSIQGQASGGGSFLLSAGNGLEVLDANLGLRLSGTIANEIGILELIPGVKSYAKKYKILRKFNDMVKLGTQVSPHLDLAAQFAQNDSGDLAFTRAEGELGLMLRGSIYCDFLGLGILRTRLWLAGDGTLYLELPEPLLRQMILKFQAGAVINIRWVLREEVTFNAWCKWSRDSGIRCGTGNVVTLSSVDAPDTVQLRLITTDYDRFGPYSQMKPRRLLRHKSAATPVNAEVTSMVSNLFPGASPSLTNVGSGSLLMWEHQDPSKPVLQSTEIAFSWNGGGGWTTPLLINDDTRAEFDPIASEDGSGGAVAAWLRSSDPNFDQVPGTFDGLAPFFKQMEIVTARFDPGSQSWTQPAPLTQNHASETDLHLAFSGDGTVWLTWLENDAGEPLSTADAPSRLRYSTWNGSSWSVPADIIGGLVGVDSHALAVSPSGIFVLVPVDPDLDVEGDERIDFCLFLGSGWSHRTFTGGDGTENRHPSVAFDSSGLAHIVWIRNGDLVHATLQNPTPSIVREGGGAGFFDSKLLASPEGHLMLAFQRETEEGPGDVFALVYDALTNSWSVDRRLTEQTNANAYDLTGYFDPAGKVHLAYLNNYANWVTKTVPMDGQDWEIPGIPEEGRTDLEMLERSLITDLAIAQTDVSLVPAEPKPGQTTEVRVKVHNSGDFPIGNVDVSLLQSSSFGLLHRVASTTIPEIKAGDSRDVTLSIDWPQPEANVRRLTVAIDDRMQISEFSRENNSVAVPIANLPPVADPVAGVTKGLAPLAVDLDGSTSLDPDGEVVGFEWSIPDVAKPIAAMKTTFTFDQPGTYPVGLTVTDEWGRRSTSYVTITVQPSRHFFPFYQANRSAFTGFAVSNFSNEQAKLEMRLYDAAGNLAAGPISKSVEPGTQLAQLGRELFALPPTTTESGWVEIRSDNPEVGSFFLFGDGSGLDGALDSLRYSKRLYFTRVFEGATAFRGHSASTYLSIANPSGEKAVVDLTLYLPLPGGMAPADQVTREIPARGFLYRSVDKLFEDQPSISDGYVALEVREGGGVAGFSLVTLKNQQTTIGFGGAAADSGASQCFSAQLASWPGVLYTNLRLINVSDERRDIELTAIGEDGTPLAESVTRTLWPGVGLQADVADLFGFEGSGLFVGSLRVEADGAGILGDVVFGSPNLRNAAAMPLQCELASRAIFSQVANIPGSFFTGLAFYNPQRRTAELGIEVFRSDGSSAGSQEIALEPGHRISKRLDELVPASAGVVRGYVRIESTEPLVLQEMFGDFAQSILAAVPPTIVE